MSSQSWRNLFQSRTHGPTILGYRNGDCSRLPARKWPSALRRRLWDMHRGAGPIWLRHSVARVCKTVKVDGGEVDIEVRCVDADQTSKSGADELRHSSRVSSGAAGARGAALPVIRA